MGDVQLQADIGSLSIAGLGAFSSVLAILSADNVMPTALLQIEQLGSLFPTNGKFARQTPDFLTRFTTTRLERLGVAIGWRKNDTASLLAQSAGGQAAALLICVLTNLYGASGCAEILYSISPNLLSSQMCLASPRQLTHAVDILAAKMSAVGFGNFLAETALRIAKAYQAANMQMSYDLFAGFAAIETMSELLCGLSTALREDKTILRISGTTGLGNIAALMLCLFPNDVSMSLQGIIMHQGVNTRIILEFSEFSGSQSAVIATIESQVTTRDLTNLVLPKTGVYVRPAKGDLEMLSFKWHGWLGSRLDLDFASFGLVCRYEDKAAFTTLLVSALACSLQTSSSMLSDAQATDSFGQDPRSHISTVCNEIIGIATWNPVQVDMAFFRFALLLEIHIKEHKLCNCPRWEGDDRIDWLDFLENNDCPTELSTWLSRHRDCRSNALLCNLSYLLEKGLLCFFINADENATLGHLAFFEKDYTSRQIHNFLHTVKGGQFTEWNDFANFFRLVALDEHYENEEFADVLMVSNGSTIYPEPLRTLKATRLQRRFFHLAEGRLTYENQYHEKCTEVEARRPLSAEKSLLQPGQDFVPSSIGKHADLLTTLRDTQDGLVLKSMLRYDGSFHGVQLKDCIRGFRRSIFTSPCAHPSNRPLDSQVATIWATSVAAPWRHRVGPTAVMTKGSPTAQLLACEYDKRALFMVDCCLECAFHQATEEKCHMIIAT